MVLLPVMCISGFQTDSEPWGAFQHGATMVSHYHPCSYVAPGITTPVDVEKTSWCVLPYLFAISKLLPGTIGQVQGASARNNI
jgi:hypothetical protein